MSVYVYVYVYVCLDFPSNLYLKKKACAAHCSTIFILPYSYGL